MNRLIGNLLDMIRVESGALRRRRNGSRWRNRWAWRSSGSVNGCVGYRLKPE